MKWLCIILIANLQVFGQQPEIDWDAVLDSARAKTDREVNIDSMVAAWQDEFKEFCPEMVFADAVDIYKDKLPHKEYSFNIDSYLIMVTVNYPVRIETVEGVMNKPLTIDIYIGENGTWGNECVFIQDISVEDFHKMTDFFYEVLRAARKDKDRLK